MHLKIHIQRTNIFTGFYICEKDNIDVCNSTISIVAYCIFKENMPCKNEWNRDLIEKVTINLKFYTTVIGIQNYRVVLNTLH